jgi:succinate dehydrogenase / fumarate reductase flavoprotein subunit/fumarate reductase flavoprotein subunit
MSRLRDQIFASDISVLENTRGLELLTSSDGSRVIGAVLLDIQSGEFITVKSKAVILCTGAGPLMYARSACAQEKACDGIGMAFRAGAHLMDMEMVQFHPTGLVVPGSRLNGALLEEGLRGAGAHLFNGLGERYMEKYDPEKKERSTRDRVSRAGFMEITAGRGTENGAVFIDVTHLGAEFVEKNFAGMRDRCLRIGYDLAREKVEVAPTAHFNMGGIRIDKNGSTNLEGLFAAGEDAAGVHGANRLGGNGVAESTVYGARVGDFVANWVKQIPHDEPSVEQIRDAQNSANQFLENKNGENPFALREELGKLMWEKVGIVRDGMKLSEALFEISKLKERSASLAATGGRQFNLCWHQTLDLRNLLTASELIARSASLREESRGAHYREDFPQTDNPNWLRNIFLSREGISTKNWSESVKLVRLQPKL